MKCPPFLVWDMSDKKQFKNPVPTKDPVQL
jgi:hypothetical protein